MTEPTATDEILSIGVRVFDDPNTSMEDAELFLRTAFHLPSDLSVKCMIRIHEHGSADVVQFAPRYLQEMVAHIERVNRDLKSPLACKVIEIDPTLILNLKSSPPPFVEAPTVSKYLNRYTLVALILGFCTVWVFR